MKNTFDIEVSFDKYPINQYNFTKVEYITNVSVIRVTTKCIKDILTYECNIDTNKSILLLSDTKLCVALKIKGKKVVALSYLTYDKDSEISEYACNLKIKNISYSKSSKKIIYKNLDEDKNRCNYIVHEIKNIRDDNKLKYLYYLYFNNIDDYKKERLIKEINDNPNKNIEKLYNFLIKAS